MEQNTYVGYECDECGEEWNVHEENVTLPPTCPQCDHETHNIVQFEATIVKHDTEGGVYECFDCGHTFSYVATRPENPDETPSCTHCHSDSVVLMY